MSQRELKPHTQIPRGSEYDPVQGALLPVPPLVKLAFAALMPLSHCSRAASLPAEGGLETVIDVAPLPGEAVKIDAPPQPSPSPTLTPFPVRNVLLAPLPRSVTLLRFILMLPLS